jgi:signal transduction histidine kinase
MTDTAAPPLGGNATASAPGGAPDGAEPSTLLRPGAAAALLQDERARWLVWRRRGLILAALLGCLGVFLMIRWMAALPHIDAQWQRGAQGQLVLESSAQPSLNALRGHAVLALRAPNGRAVEVDASLLHRAPRWQASDSARQLQARQQQSLAQLLADAAPSSRLELRLDTGDWVAATLSPRGYGGLGLAFWPLVGVALLLYLFASILLWAKSQPRHLPLVVMSLCQVLNLLCLVLETLPGLALGVAWSAPHQPGELDWGTASRWCADLRLRLALDLCIGAALVHAFALHPRPLPRAKPLILLAWGLVPLWLLLTDQALPTLQGAAFGPGLWWWGQAGFLALLGIALVAVRRSYRVEANPYALVLQRFGVIAMLTFLLATAAAGGAAAWAETRPAQMGLAAGLALAVSLTWNTLVTALMLMIPFMARSPQLFREFATLAGVSTVATSIDLLFVAVFALGPFTSLAVAVFVSLALYAALRQRVLNRLLGQRSLTTERTFDHIYRAARAVQAQPTQYTQRLTQLLRDVFEPMEVLRVDAVPQTTRVSSGGSALVVPFRSANAADTSGAGADDDPSSAPAFALGLRFAQRGQRLFTEDDARLADRVVEQLARAVAYDRAVEQGRHEERLRIAQDLHDDIGARLLTLMYQAKTPEMEDYIRHTLQDLKTLTRGLAAHDHLLSHACGEWKADLSQRLSAARASLGWLVVHDRDLPLSMVQWSALTRVLRELVSNSLYHGHASRVNVELSLQGPQLKLSVSDNGLGKAPQNWAHGLGLGGVRKRVKALGGTVIWSENPSTGILCEVQVADFAPANKGTDTHTNVKPGVSPA